MTRILPFAAVLAVMAAVIAGCNGANNSTSTATILPCGTPAGMLASLSYPVPGAVNVPDNLAQVIVDTNYTLPSDWQAGLGWDVVLLYNANVNAYGTGHFGNGFVGASTPYPTPTATPSFSNPAIWSSTINYVNAPNLPPATVITVELNDLENQNCFGGPVLGTFTSQ